MTILFASIFSLIFFEGFIILCDGGSVTESEGDSEIDVSASQSHLPKDLVNEILYRAGFETTKRASNRIEYTDEVIERIFQDHIIVIKLIPAKEHKEIIEFEKSGKRYLEIRNYTKLMKLFEHFGKNVRKIFVHYIDDDMRRQINQNIIKKYKNQLTELVMFTSQAQDNELIWEGISDEKGEIHFPNVKTFKYTGHLKKNPFDVNKIFPKIRILKLKGVLDDINCLKNVRNLEELTFDSHSIGEEEFVKIIANNKQITKLSFYNKFKPATRTVQSIAQNLKNLKTFTVVDIGNGFIFRNNNVNFNLPSITSFSFYGQPGDLFVNIPFDMPNLENLKLIGFTKGDAAKFVNRFHKLKTANLWGMGLKRSLNCIQQLIHVEVFVTDYDEFQLTDLKSFFENFDKKISKLNTIKWVDFEEDEYPPHEVEMEEINDHLENSGKPTWQISHGYQDDHAGKSTCYLMLKRDA